MRSIRAASTTPNRKAGIATSCADSTAFSFMTILLCRIHPPYSE
jgi:hypothetical protein